MYAKIYKTNKIYEKHVFLFAYFVGFHIKLIESYIEFYIWALVISIIATQMHEMSGVHEIDSITYYPRSKQYRICTNFQSFHVAMYTILYSLYSACN